MDVSSFANQEAATFWRYITGSVDRFVALAATLDLAGLTWRPPAPETNSIYALAIH